jgi:mono/diheme cytochrome c family protein
MSKKTVGVLLFATCFVLAASIQAQDNPGIKKVPVTRTSPAAGKEMFVHYCASCHGKEGKGNGPAASALKKAPADLSTLASRNGGKFPDTRVYAYVEGTDEVASHGSREMPIWGDVFRSMSPADAAAVHQRVSNLTEYVRSLQQK